MRRHVVAVFLATLVPMAAEGQTNDALPQQVAMEKAPLLGMLRDLVNIESGSRDIDGLNRISELIATRLRALGGAVD
jgi:glutamate carboxypeptidase